MTAATGDNVMAFFHLLMLSLSSVAVAISIAIAYGLFIIIISFFVSGFHSFHLAGRSLPEHNARTNGKSTPKRMRWKHNTTTTRRSMMRGWKSDHAAMRDVRRRRRRQEKNPSQRRGKSRTKDAYEK